ncbi:Inositol 2-dehydrogenase/D-chiro-inositol 3-dehydrogenase [Paenibacillus solanacearum]|uniref:Inositol 2-dehydrogenase/D-chiro-inositol 3-dehydrogenase n=1 Tax=Paenibacillus solanacearum TaxID=2048548 RepID=A0A916JR58_9BACL|nr:Gfo/Idh/MocA family oxidoreductase [Paenibacillus solanacearum]CAG7596389.1 Inositol 2-dehydrogenase/D-chiro-inositol 3-dehydrogenase [Paenibacillus solanacearum]
MGKRLKLGAIGTGNIFKGVHMRGWKDHPEVELFALCDVAKDKAEALAEQYGVKHVFADYRELLAMDEIDIVDICTSNLYHSEIAVAALQAGKHVFCEKPDAVSPEEAQKMAEAAKQSGKTLMVMRNNRFRPASQFLKAYIENGHMGDVYTGRCGWIRRRGIPGKGGWFTTKELSGGGPLIDLGVHFIDLTVWLMGNPRPVSVVGATYCKFAGSNVSDSVHSQFGESQANGTFDVEDLATGFIRFDNGATLQIEFSWASNIEEEMNFLELRGSRAGASFKKGELKLFSEIEGILCDIAPRLPKDVGGHEKHLHHFVDVVQGHAEPVNTPETGVDMIKILSAIYESARTGSEVKL